MGAKFEGIVIFEEEDQFFLCKSFIFAYRYTCIPSLITSNTFLS